MDDVVNRRSYRSPLRQEQAAATRTRILDASLGLFRERGYSATPVRVIADTAGVSVQTLYQSWGSKPAIVEGLLRRVKDEIDLPGLFAAMAAGPHDPLKLLARSAYISRRYSEAGWDVLELVRHVAYEQPEVAAIWEEGEASRYRGQHDVVDWIAACGALQAGLAVDDAAGTLWALSSHDVYRALVRDRGRTPAQYEAWLVRTTSDLLLGTGPATPFRAKESGPDG